MRTQSLASHTRALPFSLRPPDGGQRLSRLSPAAPADCIVQVGSSKQQTRTHDDGGITPTWKQHFRP